ncbi:hypothetical protein LP417_29145 [Polaromonas sp. P1-6]|nr:hypothetical protein LP417_29145 [Polaromonas sp. P1-6]
MPMHVGSFNLCELPPGFKGSFHKQVKAHIAKRVHLAPVFSRQLVFMPFDLGHPLWVEAESVDVDFHVRRADPAKKRGFTDDAGASAGAVRATAWRAD